VRQQRKAAELKSPDLKCIYKEEEMAATDILAVLHNMRTTEYYLEAEMLRRKKGATAMVCAPADSEDHAAIRCLLGTWEMIAAITLPLAEAQRKRVFEVMPILHMYTELEDAIKILREKDPDYATKFERLMNEQDFWLKTDGLSYRSGHVGGVHAYFG